MSRTEPVWWFEDDGTEPLTPLHTRMIWRRRWMAMVLILGSLGALLTGIGLWSEVSQRDSGHPLPKPDLVSNTGLQTTDGTPSKIEVDVHGDVRRPGVYQLSGNARIVDAVKAAGGFVHAVDANAVDGAEQLNDGQEVVIPTAVNQTMGGASTAPALTSDGRATASETVKHNAVNPMLTPHSIDINTAGEATLLTLPGIGPVKAEAIISYRKQHGLFRSLTDLRRVHGIGPVTWARITPYLVVSKDAHTGS